MMERALTLLAEAVEAGPIRQLILVVDGAGWHTPKPLKEPAGVHLVFLHQYSLEMQSAERLGPLVNEAIANRTFDNIEVLEEFVVRRCLQLTKQQHYIRHVTRHHWWSVLPQRIISCIHWNLYHLSHCARVISERIGARVEAEYSPQTLTSRWTTARLQVTERHPAVGYILEKLL